ncbi:restriction endonuclease [Priestia sp. D51]
MSLPCYDEIHWPLLSLITHRKIYSLKEAVNVLAGEFGLTNEELNETVPSGVKKFYSQVSFSKMLLIRAGLIFKDIKPFKITTKAKKLLAQNPTKITKRCLDELANDTRIKTIHKEKGIVCKPLMNTYKEYLNKLEKIDASYFESVSGLILSKVYNVDFLASVEITSKNNDGGIDGVVHLGRNEGSKVYFQSKIRRGYSIGQPLVRDFSGALDGVYGIKGFFITTSKFSSEAVKYVKKLRHKEIILIDGYKLVELIFKYKLENKIKLD